MTTETPQETGYEELLRYWLDDELEEVIRKKEISPRIMNEKVFHAAGLFIAFLRMHDAIFTRQTIQEILQADGYGEQEIDEAAAFIEKTFLIGIRSRLTDILSKESSPQ